MKIFDWLKQSNRLQHFGYAIPCAFLFTLLFVAGLAAGMEFKDNAYSNKWDWLDFTATILGGIVGQTLQILVAYIIFGYYYSL